MYYVVTGAAGFIGSNLVKALNERGITDILAVDDLKDLISEESVERLDDGSQVETFGHWLDSVLTLGRAVVVIGTLEDEAHKFRHETDLVGFSPAE